MFNSSSSIFVIKINLIKKNRRQLAPLSGGTFLNKTADVRRFSSGIAALYHWNI